MRRSVPGLEALFVRLRAADVPVGLLEIRRLGTILQLEPSLDGDGLRRVIEGVVIKSERHREPVRRAFAQWLRDAESAVRDLDAGWHHHEGEAGDEAGRAPSRAKRSRDAQAVASPSGNAASPGGMSRASAPAAAPSPPSPPAARAAASESAPAARPRGGDLFDVEEPAPEPAAAPASVERITTQRRLEQARSQERSNRIVKLVAAASLIAALIIAIGVYVAVQWTRGESPPPRDPTVANGDPSRPDVPVIDPPIRMTEIAAPELVIIRARAPDPDWLGILLPALALIFGAGLWSRFGQGRWVPRAEPEPEPPPAGSPERSGDRPRQTLILDQSDEEHLVWGVGRFVSDELSSDLDVSRTVEETASAFGRPVLRYEAERFQREVWLWVDESMESPAARHLADDLAVMLGASGLPVVRARFWGVPERLQTAGDEHITADELDARRDRMAVAVLTDGRLLTRAAEARERRDRVNSLLRGLSHWPRVTFIDFSHDEHRLQALLGGHGLRAIQPRDAAAALSDLAAGTAQGEPVRLTGDARVWAAVCAMAPSPVDDRSALVLRQRLGLDVTPWAIETLRASSTGDATGMSWPTRLRAQLLDWLVDVEQLPEAWPLSESSLLGRIGKAWDRVYDDREREIERSIEHVAAAAPVSMPDVAGAGWQPTREREILMMERALIHLWDQPQDAIDALYTQYRQGSSRVAGRIRTELGRLVPRDARAVRAGDQAGVIALPWTLEVIGPGGQVMLHEMGFGARSQVALMESLPRPGRLWLALGLCAGVGLGATSAIAHEYLTREVPEPKIVVGNAPDGKNVYAKIEPDATGLQRAVVRTPWSAQTELVEDGDKVVVEWEHERLWCEEERPAYVIKRCPELGGDGAGSGDDARSYWSFAVIDVRAAADTKPTEGPAPANKRSLADELSALLLASGSVDGVFLVTADEGFAAVAAEHQLAMGSADQLLVVAPSVAEAIPPGFPGRFVVFDTAALRSLVVPWNFSGESTIAAVYPELAPLRRTEAAFRIRGFGACGRLDQPCCQDLPGSDIGWDGCSEALRCDRGSMTCVEPPPRCAFAKQRCDATGTRIEICLPNGSVVKQSCGDGRCVDGMCRPVICKQGATRCADRGEQRCVADGTAWEITRPCGREERCKGDRCVSVPQVFVEFLAVKLDVKRTKAWLRHFLECSVDGKPVLGMRLSEVQSGLKNRGAAVRGPDSFVVACSVAGSRMRDARKHKFVRSDIGRHTLELSDDRVELVVEYQVRPADLSVYKDIAPSK